MILPNLSRGASSTNIPSPTTSASPIVWAATSPVNGTGPLETSLSVSSLNPINTTQEVAAGAVYNFDVGISNPNPSAQPPYPCNFQLVLTENSSQAAIPSDAKLEVFSEGTHNGQPNAAYNYYANVTPTAEGNTLMFA